MLVQELLKKTKNFVFIGEAGSGKTETSLNLAVEMAKATEKEVHFFDMDQTKPLFRARDSAGEMERDGVQFHFQNQYLDAPVVASGVRECLTAEDKIVLMDIGGGSHGSHMIGQFSDLLNREQTEVLYIVNPYRPWSRTRTDIEETYSRVMGTAHLNRMSLVANPNLGLGTTAEDVCLGMEKLSELLPEHRPLFICALESFAEQVEATCRLPTFPIRLNTLPDWFRE